MKPCNEHQIEGCQVCMIDDFYEWYQARIEHRRAYKKQWRDTPVHERFDLGGEA